MLIAYTWHISFHFFKLLSQLPLFDPDRNPVRQVEEVINDHSRQASSSSQQVGPEHRGLCVSEDTEGTGWEKPCPRLIYNLQKKKQMNRKAVRIQVSVNNLKYLYIES
jgi:hypothetical protein